MAFLGVSGGPPETFEVRNWHARERGGGPARDGEVTGPTRS